MSDKSLEFIIRQLDWDTQVLALMCKEISSAISLNFHDMSRRMDAMAHDISNFSLYKEAGITWRSIMTMTHVLLFCLYTIEGYHRFRWKGMPLNEALSVAREGQQIIIAI